jgi:uncharacterized membrane protein YcaP (DUF421 family)
VDSVLRAAAVYLFLLLLVRLTGKRSLAQITTFDFILLLVVSEAAQQALFGDDFSVTNGLLVITTLVTLDRALDWFAFRSRRMDRWVNDSALVLMEDGRMHRDRMERMHVQDEDILEKAREQQGLERLDQIKHAVLERTGTITVVPRRG